MTIRLNPHAEQLLNLHEPECLAVRFGDFAVLFAIADDGGIGHLGGQFFKMLFELVELVGVLHG